MSMIREKVLKAIEKLKEEELEGVLDYINLIQEPEEVEPTEEEKEAIRQGREDHQKGDFIKWEDLRRS
ncbi:MAG: hypothetical protein NTX88_01945 [Candidatus Atribacteria bacterium]|nr:hypothetical protein [Candidatus Atribacteria bacterium]